MGGWKGPHGRSGCCGVEKNPLPLPELEPRPSLCRLRSPTLTTQMHKFFLHLLILTEPLEKRLGPVGSRELLLLLLNLAIGLSSKPYMSISHLHRVFYFKFHWNIFLSFILPIIPTKTWIFVYCVRAICLVHIILLTTCFSTICFNVLWIMTKPPKFRAENWYWNLASATNVMLPVNLLCSISHSSITGEESMLWSPSLCSFFIPLFSCIPLGADISWRVRNN
jgi:hypothetical protein